MQFGMHKMEFDDLQEKLRRWLVTVGHRFLLLRSLERGVQTLLQA